LAAAGGGDPGKAPSELVAIFGDTVRSAGRSLTFGLCPLNWGKWSIPGNSGAVLVSVVRLFFA
jgi:hypothetical protein